MNWFHALQALFGLSAVALAGRLGVALLLRAPLDVPRLRAWLRKAPWSLRRPALLRIAEAGLPSWPAIVVLQQFRDVGSDDTAEGLLSELLLRSLRELSALMTLGRIAPPLAFLGAILELTAAFDGGHGIEGLQRGLPAQLALGRATTGVCLGAVTAVFCFTSARLLGAHARRLERETRRLMEDVAQLEQPATAPDA